MSEAGTGIEGFRDHSAFAEYVAGQLGDASFSLIDVGCAGGLAPGWRTFGDRLRALAFDADASEVERLAVAETNPEVRYVAGFVGLPAGHPLKVRIGPKSFWHNWPSGRVAYERTHDVRKAKERGEAPQSLKSYFEEILSQPWKVTPVEGFDLDYARAFEVFPPMAATTAPGGVIHLPPFLQAAGFYDADFLKLDVDGPDYEILRSVSDLLSQPSLLGASLEVCYYGSHDANDNSFHNVDRLMREKGFDLFGLSVRSYSSAALPFAYLDNHPSMNVGGRPVQGDALYIRDLGSRARTEEAAAVSDEKLAKTAALFALFNLPDHAAEILLVHRERLSTVMDVDKGLDILTRQIQPNDHIADNFVGYTAEFEAENPLFFAQYEARNQWMAEMIRISKEEPLARVAAERRAEEAERQAGEAEMRAQEAAEALGRARVEAQASQLRLADIEGSTSWKLTAPLRALLGALRGRR